MISTPSPIRPLNVGNVVSASFRLYRDHFSVYLGISFRATLWILGAIVLALPIGLGAFALKESPGGAAAFLALAIPAWLVGLLYCTARYEAGMASITRLAFGELTEEPESPESALRFTQSRQWSFLGGSILVGLIAMVATFGALLLLFIPIGIILAMSGVFNFSRYGGGSSASSSAMIIGVSIAVLLGLVLLLVWILGIYWLSARLYLSLVPLAIETQSTAMVSIQRGWSLTKNSAWRLVAILFIAGMLLFPLQLVVSIVQNILELALRAAYPSRSVEALQGIAVLVSLVLGQGAGILMVPFIRTLQAVIYADLRSRREGADLALRDR
jgi:hypothetical protein